MSDIKKLIDSCKFGVFLSVNEHLDYYDDTVDVVEELDIDQGIKEIMIKTNTVVRLQFYPISPIGFYEVFHFDVDEAVKIALGILREENE